MGFWNGKKVFVTGHTGFKGSWMCHLLARQGAQIIGYSLPAPTTPSLFVTAKTEATLLENMTGDVRDLGSLTAAIKRTNPDVCIHMAAQALVRDSYADPVSTFATNVMGTVNVFEAMRSASNLKVMVNVTSDKCYENREWEWGYREIEAMGGSDPYSASKGCAELVMSAFRKSFFADSKVRIASGRAGNVIGGGDWARDRLIPDAVRAFSKQEVVQIRNPMAIRPWQHVLEPVNGYLMLAEKLWDNPELVGGWNFGPDQDDAKPVGWMMDRFCAVWGKGAQWKLVADATAPKEAFLLKLDCAKARMRLGWVPALTVDDAVSMTAQWYQGFYAGVDAEQLVNQQVEKYQSRFNKPKVKDERATFAELPVL